MTVIVIPPHAGCSCNHERARHLGQPGAVWCGGLDSYDRPCTCPSFELSQECREALERGEQL